MYISPLDLGPKYTDKLGTGFLEYSKTYGENYCLGQLIFWHNQTSADPDCSLAKASRGCLSLPDIGSFYAKVQKPSRQRVYGPKTVRFMLARMVSCSFGFFVLCALCKSCLMQLLTLALIHGIVIGYHVSSVPHIYLHYIVLLNMLVHS